MGIFNRNNQDKPQFDFEGSQQAPATPHVNPSAPPAAPTRSQAPSSGGGIQRQQKRSKVPYSIEDAIKLMRELPNDQREIVVSIVQKTLSSANISVEDIIDDASRKLNRLGSRTKQLSAEIEELEAGITERQSEIEKITKDTNETESVKSSFEDVLQQNQYESRRNNQSYDEDPQDSAS